MYKIQTTLKANSREHWISGILTSNSLLCSRIKDSSTGHVPSKASMPSRSCFLYPVDSSKCFRLLNAKVAEKTSSAIESYRHRFKYEKHPIFKSVIKNTSKNTTPKVIYLNLWIEKNDWSEEKCPMSYEQF